MGATDALPNFPKKHAANWGTTRSFSRGSFPEDSGTVAHLPLSHDQGCLRFMSHLYSFITYLASKKRAPGLPSPPAHSASGSVCVLSTHILLALPVGLHLVPVCLLTRWSLGRGFWLSRSTHGNDHARVGTSFTGNPSNVLFLLTPFASHRHLTAVGRAPHPSLLLSWELCGPS